MRDISQATIGRGVRKGAALTLLVALATSATALEARFSAEVRRTLTAEDGIYGGCMARLSVSPHSEGLDCRTQPWVTFDCAGEYHSKSAAMRMFDTAQVAQLTGRTVEVIVDDTRKHGGFCLVRRMDLLGPPAD